MSDGARVPGPVEAAVAADIRDLGALAGGVRRSLAQVALFLARAIDARGEDAGPTTTAQLARELRSTLVALTWGDDDDDDGFGAVAAALSPELGYAAESGAGDVRAGDREGGA